MALDSLDDLFETLLSILEWRRVDYMLVGAIGVFLWGEPRYSRDIDIVVTARKEGADLLISDLLRAGLAGPPPESVVRHALLRVPRSPEGLMVDVWVRRSEEMLRTIPPQERAAFRRWIRYDDAAARRKTTVPYGGRGIYIARPEDIIIPKVDFSARSPQRYAKDSADICAILMRQGRSIDRRYLVRWLRYLGLWGQFERIEEGCIPRERPPARPRSRPAPLRSRPRARARRR